MSWHGHPCTFGVPAARGKLSPSRVVYKPVVQVGCKLGGGGGDDTQKPHSAGKSENLFRLRKGSPSGKAFAGDVQVGSNAAPASQQK